MKQQNLLGLNAIIIVLGFACSASAWNTSTHMVTGSIAYRILENETPRTVSVIKTSSEKASVGMQIAGGTMLKSCQNHSAVKCSSCSRHGGADDIRMQAKLQREARWHYINFPFKPTGEPEDINSLAENQRIVKARYQRINGNRAVVAVSAGWRRSSALTYGTIVHPRISAW